MGGILGCTYIKHINIKERKNFHGLQLMGEGGFKNKLPETATLARLKYKNHDIFEKDFHKSEFFKTFLKSFFF